MSSVSRLLVRSAPRVQKCSTTARSFHNLCVRVPRKFQIKADQTRLFHACIPSRFANKKGEIEDADFVMKGEKEADSRNASPDVEAPQAEPTDPLENLDAHVTGNSEDFQYQAETRKLLDIVAKSLYTDKEVFIRELISNASDALEKLRVFQLDSPISDPELGLRISLFTKEKENKIIIEDTGIGLTKEEIVDNLGTIARSGTEQFIQTMQKGGGKSSDLIGKFGVGFYSVFVVGKNVKVYTKSAKEGSTGHLFQSDGSGKYTVTPIEGMHRGTRIEVELKEDSDVFSKKAMVESVIKKFSNFVSFDIFLNSHKVNTVQPIWTKPKSDVTREDHIRFYQFIAHSYDEPLYYIHYQTDSPFDIKCVFYVPPSQTEGVTGQRMELGVSLYCRKVLIQSKATSLLPEWLRFMKGVVDCADISLNLSREHLQDSTVIGRVGSIITRRILKNLHDQSLADPDKYNKFYRDFNRFFKEGVCTDVKFKDDVIKLLRFSSSNGDEYASLDDYISRATPEQAHKKEIYYYSSSTRQMAESSPYYESFKESNTEVLFIYSPMDEVVMSHIGQYKDYTLKSITTVAAPSNKEPEAKTEHALEKDEFESFKKWFHEKLSDKISVVKEATRTFSAPAVITDHESATIMRMMKQYEPSLARQGTKVVVQINTSHPVIIRLNHLRKKNSEIADVIARGVFDNAYIAAGLCDDPQELLPRLNKLLDLSVKDVVVEEEVLDLPKPPKSPKGDKKSSS